MPATDKMPLQCVTFITTRGGYRHRVEKGSISIATMHLIDLGDVDTVLGLTMTFNTPTKSTRGTGEYTALLTVLVADIVAWEWEDCE